MIYSTFGNPVEINIRPAVESDIPTFVRWMNNPEVQETFVSKKRTFTVEGQTKQLEKMTPENPKDVIYSILFAQQLIGRLKLSKINWETKTAHTSILIEPNPNFRGKGYGTIALKLLIELSKEIGLKKLISKIQKENIVSIKLHQKAGFINTTAGTYILEL